MKIISQLCSVLLFTYFSAVHVTAQPLGMYFAKKQYLPEPLPAWQTSRDSLPVPVLDADPGWIDMYWKCWEIAFMGLKLRSTNGS